VSGTPNADFDERLAEALNLALSDGEEIVAREAGDQGQAIALTKNHIMLVRVGLAATGDMDGHKTTKLALAEVTAVNFRKGALGAVIQVCSSQVHAGAPNGAPENVIVFTGPGRVKKAETFAEAIEFATGKTVNRVGLLPQAPARDQEPAEQTHVEEIESQPAEPAVQAEAPQEIVEAAPVEVQEPVAAAVVSEPEVEEPAELSAREGYNPNPRLPKPVRKHKQGPNRMLVVLGVLAGLTVVGMAVMAPMREAQLAPAPIVGTSGASVSQRSVRLQLSAVTNYDRQVSDAMAKANGEVSALRSAVGSGSQSAVQDACRPGRIDDAWQKIGALSPPSGLAEANENLLNGLLMMKNAAGAASASATVDSKEALARFGEAESMIRRGQAAITAQRSSLEKQAAGLPKPTK
jgi:hypothetical protein